MDWFLYDRDLRHARIKSFKGNVFFRSSWGVSENFAKFTGKHLCQSLFFNKVANRTFLPRDAFVFIPPMQNIWKPVMGAAEQKF